MNRTDNKGYNVAKVKGYMTVEAAFIIPWVIFLFVFIIYASFFLYDGCAVFQDSYALAVRAANKQLDNSSLEKYLYDNAAKQYGNKYIAVRGITREFQVSDKEVMVKAYADVRYSAGKGEVLPDISNWKIKAELKASRENPAEFIRTCRAVTELSGGGR